MRRALPHYSWSPQETTTKFSSIVEQRHHSHSCSLSWSLAAVVSLDLTHKQSDNKYKLEKVLFLKWRKDTQMAKVYSCVASLETFPIHSLKLAKTIQQTFQALMVTGTTQIDFLLFGNLLFPFLWQTIPNAPAVVFFPMIDCAEKFPLFFFWYLMVSWVGSCAHGLCFVHNLPISSSTFQKPFYCSQWPSTDPSTFPFCHWYVEMCWIWDCLWKCSSVRCPPVTRVKNKHLQGAFLFFVTLLSTFLIWQED